MLYLLAGKHGLHMAKDESGSGSDSDSQSHHRHHEAENRTAPCQHGHRQSEDGGTPSKKKLASSKSCSAATCPLKNPGLSSNAESKCKHQSKEKPDAKTASCNLHRSATIDTNAKAASIHRSTDSAEREDGEKVQPKASQAQVQGSPIAKVKMESKGKSFSAQLSSEELLAKRKRCAYHRSATCADNT